MDIGIDIISIERIKNVIEKWGDRFIDRIYTIKEKDFCFRRKNFEECFAGRFAVKEAIYKTLNDESITLKDIEIIGRNIYIKGILNQKIKFSISHEKDYAVASALKID